MSQAKEMPQFMGGGPAFVEIGEKVRSTTAKGSIVTNKPMKVQWTGIARKYGNAQYGAAAKIYDPEIHKALRIPGIAAAGRRQLGIVGVRRIKTSRANHPYNPVRGLPKIILPGQRKNHTAFAKERFKGCRNPDGVTIASLIVFIQYINLAL